MRKKCSMSVEKEDYEKIEKTCKFCGEKFYKVWTKYSLSEFCSKTCSKKYSSLIKREEVNKKVSASLKNFYKNNPNSHSHKIRNTKSLINGEKITSVQAKEEYYKNPKTCCICGKVIDYERKKNKTCSLGCQTKCANLTKQKNGTVFVENGQGRSKSGYYKGFFCNSTYELVYYIYMTEHGNIVERNLKNYEYVFEGKHRNYTPDFRVNGKLVEIKGYHSKQVQAKIESVKDEELSVLYYSDLEYMMNYVDEKYGTKHTTKSNNYFILYDNHKPELKYEYICSICGKKFKSKWKRNKKFKFIVCSMECRTKSKRTINEKLNFFTPDGFYPIPTLDGYYINKEKKVWSSWFRGKFIKLQKVKGIYEKYSLCKDGKQKWYFPDELYDMTFNT